MLTTASVLNLISIQRATSLAGRFAQNPTQTATLEGVRQRNAILDSIFYDIKIIKQEEATLISPWLAAEGSILIVPPSGGDLLSIHKSIEDFHLSGGHSIDTLAVAGVGSSALGAAAFARNVADATGKKVAAVVSGYGLADVVTEALGGFFWFGALNSIRHSFEILDAITEQNPAIPAGDAGRSESSPTRQSRDTKTVLDLLNDQRFAFNLLTGHSKGNLILSEALYALERENPERLRAIARSTKIVTLSARVAMPQVFKNVVDVIGNLDWLGEINSRPDIKPEYKYKTAWHHTNTEIQLHLPVTKIMKEIISPRN